MGTVSPVMGSVEGKRDILHEALVHNPAASPRSPGGQSGGGRPGSYEAKYRRSSSPGTEGSSRRSPSPWRPPRGRSPGPRAQASKSPTPGNRKLYRRTETGSLRSLDRSDIYVRGGRSGSFVRRSPSAPRKYYPFTVPSDCGPSRCVRCFRFIPSGETDVCTPDLCKRYGNKKISNKKCNICFGGFHYPEDCSKNQRTSSRERSGERNKAFNPKLA